MSFTLPDIDAGAWLDYQRKELERSLNEKVQSFGLEQAMNEQMAGLHEAAAGAQEAFAQPAPPPPPAPEPVPPLPPPPQPEPEPAPVAAYAPEEVAPEPAPARPLPQPRAAPSAASTSAAAPSEAPDPFAAWRQQLFASGMNAVEQAGGDARTFAGELAGRLDRAGNDTQAATAGALNAAQAAGVDFPTFTSSFRPPAPPQAAPEPAVPQARTAAQVASSGRVNPQPSPDEVRSYITQAAAVRGIDPDIALRVAKSEGGFEAARRGTFNTGSSWWPFQLHYGGQGYEQLGNVAGMGNQFTKETGFQPGDPNAWQAATDYALDRAARSGWGDWYGAKAQGITGKMGIGQGAGPRGVSLPRGEEPATIDDALSGKWKTSFDHKATYTGSYRTGTPHRGIDLVPHKGGIGTSVEAFQPGVVTNISRDNGAGGLMVYVQDADGLTHTYMHLAGVAPGLKVGQTVNRGDPIALMGESGTEGSPHLHYEVRKNAATGDSLDKLIDPRPYMRGGGDTTQTAASTGFFDRITQPITDAFRGGPTPEQATQQRIETGLTEMEQGRARVGQELESRIAQLGLGNPSMEDEGRRLRELAEQERLERQASGQPYDPLTAIGQAATQTGGEMAAAPGQLYGADVAAGQSLSGAVVDAAKQAGWDPDPGQERFVRNTVAQVTPSNVLISALTAGQGGLLRQIVQGTAELAGSAIGSELALEKAQEAGWPEWAQAGAQLAGGVGGGITGALGTRGAIRAAESPLGQAAIRSRLPAEAEAGFAAGMPTGGRRPPEDVPNLLDPDGRLIPKPEQAAQDLIIPGREGAPEVSQIAGPSGELLSTVTPLTRGVAGIARSVEGARHIPEPTPETLHRMPNLEYLGEDMEDIKGTLQGLAEANADQIDKYKRGTQSWETLITELAPKVGMSKEEFMKSRIGRGWNEAELLALNAAHLDQTVKAQALADEVAKAGGVKGLDPDAKVNLVNNLLDAARLQMVAEGGGSTAGRALNQQKIRLSQAQARNIAGGNERIVAERRQATATQRAERATRAAEKTAGLQEERAAAVAAAQGITDRTRAKSVAEQINKAYDDLARYQSMTLAEKDEVFLARQAERAEKAAKRAAALQSDDPAAELLKALKTELAAEEKHFGKSRESWMDMAFWAAKKDEMLNGGHWATLAGAKTIPKDPGIAGQAAWLKAQAKAAAKELEAADKQHVKAFNLELRLRERQTSQALKVLGELGSEKITDNILEEFLKVYQSGDAMATAKFLKGLRNVGFWDRANILRYAGMLSSTVTHGVQAAGGALNLAMMPTAQVIGAPIDIATQAVRGGERTRYAREAPQQVLGMVEGGRASLPDVWEVLKSGISTRAVSQDLGHARAGFGAEQSPAARAGLGALYGGLAGGATAPEDATIEERIQRAGIGAITGGVGLAAARGRRAGQAIDIAAEGPLRLMQASDIFFRGAGRGAQTRGIAYRTARNEGLVGDAARARTDEIMQHLDEFPELVDEAEKAAARVVLQEQREVQRFVPRAGIPGAAFSTVVPFSRTPINITAQGLGMSPAGVAGVVDAIRKGERGEATDRVARTLMGTAIMATATGLAVDDHLTGGYPEEAWERSTLPEGWRPWSLKVPDGNGKTNYIPFGQLGGIGYPIAMGAVYGEALRKGEPISPETLGLMAVKVGRFGADQTMVTGLNNALNALNEPERYGERFIEGLATQAVPLGGLQRQINQAMGMATRDPKGALEAMMATTVAFAPEVESKISPLGEEVQPGQTGVAAFVAPYRYGAGVAEGEDPVLDALREHEVNIPKGSDIRLGVPFTDEEQRQHQIRSGEVIRDYVERTMATPTYQTADRTKRQVMLQQAVENARNEAAGDTFRGIQSTQGQEEIRRRYLEEQSRRQPAPSR